MGIRMIAAPTSCGLLIRNVMVGADMAWATSVRAYSIPLSSGPPIWNAGFCLRHPGNDRPKSDLLGLVAPASCDLLVSQSAPRSSMKNINPNPFTTRPEIEGTFGVVASTHWIATAVGMAALERGGNAFDAAVATAFTLQVVEPHLNGPGGDVPVILYDVRKGKPELICGQGPAPAAATIAHYKSEGLDMVPGTGLLAACVPGMFDAWMLLLRDYGTMRLADVLAPAIYYAGQGHPLVERASATIATVADLFREHWPTSAAVYLPHGAVPEPGVMFRNPVL